MIKHRLFKPAQEKNKLDPKRYVTVRIWISTVAQKPTNAKLALIKYKKGTVDTNSINIGHVSLETPENYISFWPGEEPNSISKVVKAATNDLKSDIESEGGQPHHVVHLFSLDIDEINEGFEAIQQEGIGWVLTGDSSITDGKGHSCASLAYALLLRGNIEKLLSSLERSTHAVSAPLMTAGLISPNDLAKYVLLAKEDELRLHKETATFSDPETAVLIETTNVSAAHSISLSAPDTADAPAAAASPSTQTASTGGIFSSFLATAHELSDYIDSKTPQPGRNP